MNITTMTFVAPNLACGQARRGSISRSGSVTDEQRSHRPNSAQPFGRQFFFGQTSLLAPHRPLKGMLVARASSGRKIPRRERHRSYAHDHLDRTGAHHNAWADQKWAARLAEPSLAGFSPGGLLLV